MGAYNNNSTHHFDKKNHFFLRQPILKIHNIIIFSENAKILKCKNNNKNVDT